MPHHHGLPAEETHEVADGGLILVGMHRVGGVGRGEGIRVGEKGREEKRGDAAMRAVPVLTSASRNIRSFVRISPIISCRSTP